MFELAGFCGHRLKNSCLYGGRATKSPQDACQSKHQFALYRRFGVVVGNHRGFEGLVILCILERSNDGLGREAVAYSVAARTPLAFWRCWPGAFQRVATVGFDLLERAHCEPDGAIGFVSS